MNLLFCAYCGAQISEKVSHCSSCGATTETAHYIDRKENNSSYKKVGGTRIKTKNTIFDDIYNHCDIRILSKGDRMVFDVRPRDIFAVMKTKRNDKITELHKMFDGQIALIPENQNVQNIDLYNVVVNLLNSIPSTTSSLNCTGYSNQNFINLSQKVCAWNGGTKTIAIATQRIFSQILPFDTNFRFILETDEPKIKSLGTFCGIDCISAPTLFDRKNPFSQLNDNKLYVISPTEDKLFKIVSNDDNFSEIGVAVSCNCICGTMTF